MIVSTCGIRSQVILELLDKFSLTIFLQLISQIIPEF